MIEKLMPQTVVVFSYAPFFKPPMVSGGTYDFSEPLVRSMIEQIVNSDLVDIKGCAWTIDDDGTPIANFVMDQAHEIGEDLMWWCENDPLFWFNLHVFEKDNQYHIALVPDITKTISRLNDNRKLMFGEIEEQKFEKYFIIFKPIEFISSPMRADTVYKKLSISQKMRVRFMDSRILRNGLENTSQDDVFEIGIFDIQKSTYAKPDVPSH